MSFHYRNEFEDAKSYCVDTFGAPCELDDNFPEEDKYEWFACPECEEPLVAIDWDDEEDWEGLVPWSTCPICGYNWYEDTYGNYEEEDDDYGHEV